MNDRFKELVLMSPKEYDKLNVSERTKYLNTIRDYCYSLNNSKVGISITQRLANVFAPLLRNFDYEITGQGNVPKDGCLFMCNHSNSHDAFTTLEVLTKCGRPTNFLAGEEGLSSFERLLYDASGTVVINRSNKDSIANGICEFSSRLLYGGTGVVFGESTWNLHPLRPMLDMKVGGVRIALIASVPIVPVIFEYVEVSDFCEKEKDLFSKCIVRFHEPYIVSKERSLIEQTLEIQSILETMRKSIWISQGINRERIEDINREIYINHTWLKKYGSKVFEFNSEEENKFIYSKNGIVENEYFIDDSGVFRPGIIKKEDFIVGQRRQTIHIQ